MFAGVASLISSVPFLMYPRQLQDTHLVQEARRKEMASTYTNKYIDEKSLLVQLKTFPTHMTKLFHSASYVFITLGVSVTFFLLTGWYLLDQSTWNLCKCSSQHFGWSCRYDSALYTMNETDVLINCPLVSRSYIIIYYMHGI